MKQKLVDTGLFLHLYGAQKSSWWKRDMEKGAFIRHCPGSDISIKHQWLAGHHSDCTEPTVDESQQNSHIKPKIGLCRLNINEFVIV